MKFLIILCLSIVCMAEEINPISGDKIGVVNGTNIRTGGVNFTLAKNNINKKYEELSSEEKNKILEYYILRLLMKDEALKQVSKDENFKNQLTFLTKEFALEYWEKQEKEKIKISQKQIEKYYDENKEKFEILSQYKLRHIIVENETLAQEILKELNSTDTNNIEKTFVKLVKKHSLDNETIKNGGDMGWHFLEDFSKEYIYAISSLKKDDFAILKNNFGWHIVWYEDAKPKRQASLQEAKDGIKALLKEQIFNQQYIQKAKELKQKAKIAISK